MTKKKCSATGPGCALSGLRALIAAQGLQLGLGYLLVGWLIVRYLGHNGDAAGLLLLYYWAMALPGNASELGRRCSSIPICATSRRGS